MPLGTSIFLIAVGAIIRYAVTFHVSGVSRPVIGLILIIAGIAGIVGVVLSLIFMATARRRVIGGGGPYEERRF
jgi:L-cystine uptake protein TcyP (sodium:dicarboxylate symporter family)